MPTHGLIIFLLTGYLAGGRSFMIGLGVACVATFLIGMFARMVFNINIYKRGG